MCFLHYYARATVAKSLRRKGCCAKWVFEKGGPESFRRACPENRQVCRPDNQTHRQTQTDNQAGRQPHTHTARQPETTRQLKPVRITRDKEAVLKARLNTDFLKTNLSLYLRALLRQCMHGDRRWIGARAATASVK